MQQAQAERGRLGIWHSHEGLPHHRSTFPSRGTARNIEIEMAVVPPLCSPWVVVKVAATGHGCVSSG